MQYATRGNHRKTLFAKCFPCEPEGFLPHKSNNSIFQFSFPFPFVWRLVAAYLRLRGAKFPQPIAQLAGSAIIVAQYSDVLERGSPSDFPPTKAQPTTYKVAGSQTVDKEGRRPWRPGGKGRGLYREARFGERLSQGVARQARIGISRNCSHRRLHQCMMMDTAI